MKTMIVGLIVLLTGRAMAVETSTSAAGPTALLHGIAADFSGGVAWGDYASPGELDNTHAGIAVRAFTGYRFGNQIELGPVATFGFPHINTPGATDSAAFSYRAFGLQAGWLWRGKIEPFIQYFPYARLAQSSNSRLATASVRTELSYTGVAYGAGAKIYFTDRDDGAAQIGAQFLYAHESYSRYAVSSELNPLPDHPSPLFSPTSTEKDTDNVASGNSWQLGLFIGI